MSTTPNIKQVAIAFPLTVIKKAVAACMAANIPCVIWGGTGIGKSSLIKQLADELAHKLRDVRLSDKEPSDLGGIPFPEGKEGKRRVTWLPNGLLPFKGMGDDTEECILFLDEIDRCDKPTQNVALQILLDRSVNGSSLVDNCRIVAAGNGMADTGTTPLTEAAATRMIHFYVDTTSDKALDSWVRWAGRSKVDPALQGYALFRQQTFMGKETKFVELQRANPRTFDWAMQLVNICDTLEYGPEIIEPLVFGAVGCVPGREFLGYRRLFQQCPPPAVILADPLTAPIPDDLGLCFALGQQLTALASANMTVEDPAMTKQFCKYFNRFPDAQKAHWFRTASEYLPTLVGLPEYKTWEATFRVF